MISISECRKILGKLSDQLNDDEIETLRNQLYSLTNQLVDNHFQITHGRDSSNHLCTRFDSKTS